MKKSSRSLQEWLTWQEQLHLSEIDLGLERIRKVATNLSLLSPEFPIITVAGTNGKGSSVAILDAILKAQGYKVGSFTSPHLIDYNERIKIDGKDASDKLIVSAFERIDKERNKTSLTYFEFGTLAAMQCFVDENVDVAILEVGLGGRLDASNLWDTSLAIISSIAIDHVDWLGNDREIIGIEKAGIMRKGIPVICGDPEPPKSIQPEAQRIDADLIQLNTDFFFSSPGEDSEDSEEKVSKNWDLTYRDAVLNLPNPNLSGDFQLNNAATVITGLLSISSLLPVTTSAIKEGLSKVKVLGRLQVIDQSPEWLVDVAHNPHAAKALATYLRSNPVKGKTYALFSMLRDKDIKQVLSRLNKVIDEWHLVALEGSRGITLEQLKNEISQQGTTGKVIAHDSFTEAYKSLRKCANFEDRVVAFGSFLVVSEILKISGALRDHG